MNIKIEEVGPVSEVLRNLRDTVKDEVEAYDSKFNDEWVDETWTPAIDDALEMEPTDALIDQHAANTKERNFDMFSLLPISKDLEYKIKSCIKAGTITDDYVSFGLSIFRKHIRRKEFDGFHLTYELVIGKVNANHTALIAKGFTADKITSITTWHDKAQNKQNVNMLLETQINTRSITNQGIIDIVMALNKEVLFAIKGYSNSIDDKVLAKKATWNALMRQVRQTPVKKPINKKLKMGSSIVLRTNMVDKNLLQITLLTDVKVIIYRTKLKSTVLTEGTELPFNELWEGKQEDLAGTGRFVKMTNLSTERDGVVRFYELEVHCS